MPRKTRTAPSAAESAAAALASRPFADESTAPYASLSAEVRASIAESIAADRAAGLSGNELRAKYGERLSGPARRKVLREHGHGGLVARSYDSYRDGEMRNGSRHAREHGALAASRRAEAAEAAAAAAPLPEMRKALREAGLPVPAVRKGNEAPLRAAYAASLLA